MLTIAGAIILGLFGFYAVLIFVGLVGQSLSSTGRAFRRSATHRPMSVLSLKQELVELVGGLRGLAAVVRQFKKDVCRYISSH